MWIDNTGRVMWGGLETYPKAPSGLRRGRWFAFVELWSSEWNGKVSSKKKRGRVSPVIHLSPSKLSMIRGPIKGRKAFSCDE